MERIIYLVIILVVTLLWLREWLREFIDRACDYYVCEKVTIWESGGGGLNDIDRISGGTLSIVASVMYDVRKNINAAIEIRRKNEEELFATKSFAIFNDYSAAREYFNYHDRLHLDGQIIVAAMDDPRASLGPAYQAAHRMFIWAVAARNRDAASTALLKGRGEPRKLAETDLSSLLKIYDRRLRELRE